MGSLPVSEPALSPLTSFTSLGSSPNSQSNRKPVCDAYRVHSGSLGTVRIKAMKTAFKMVAINAEMSASVHSLGVCRRGRNLPNIRRPLYGLVDRGIIVNFAIALSI
jgi:hypothetical protein